jgi:ketosteroid isomerase-like protein
LLIGARGEAMASALARVVFIAAAISVLSTSTETAFAQTLTRAMLESHLKAWIAAYDAHDAEAVARLDPPANGYGFRDLPYRSSERPLSTYIDGLKTFFGSMEYYRMELNELHADVDGNIGLAWGFFTEDFKEKGRPPEKVRVRFTTTVKYDGNSWRTLLYHRDVQEFDAQARYLRRP